MDCACFRHISISGFREISHFNDFRAIAHSINAQEGGNTVCWKSMVRNRTVDDSVTYWFPWKHPMARRRGIEFGVFGQTPRKWARRLGPTGSPLDPNSSTKLPQPKHRLGPSVLAFRASQMPQPQFFARSMSASRSRTCCARLRPRWVCQYVFSCFLLILCFFVLRIGFII